MQHFAVIPQPTDFAGDGRPLVAKFRRPEPPRFEDPLLERHYLRGRLAAAARILHNEGWGIGCNMQASLRDPVDLTTFWVLPSSKALCLVDAEDVLRINVDGQIVSQGSPSDDYDRDALAMHLAIYKSRNDVNGIVHGHSPNGRAFSIQGRSISMICQDSCTFHRRVHVLPLASGLAAQTCSIDVSTALGQGKALILQNRGLLTVGGAIECALSYYIRLENLCKAQLLAEAAARGRGEGGIVLVGDEEVEFTFNNTGSEHHAWMMCMPYMARVEHQTRGSHRILA